MIVETKPPINDIQRLQGQSKHSTCGTDKEPYLWLSEKDPSRRMTDKEILDSTIDLSEAFLIKKQKQPLYKILVRNITLRDKNGLCLNMEVNLNLNDKTPFYTRPFPIKEVEKLLYTRK